jgi:hypothetical protein
MRDAGFPARIQKFWQPFTAKQFVEMYDALRTLRIAPAGTPISLSPISCRLLGYLRHTRRGAGFFQGEC